MKEELEKNNAFNIITHINGKKRTKEFRFSLQQAPKEFVVEARTEQEAREILENCDDLAEYEQYEDYNLLMQSDFELLD